MPVTKKRLYGPAQLPNTTGTRYTVPASTKTKINLMEFSNPTGGAVTITFSIGADAAGTRLRDVYSIPAGSVYTIYPGYIMDAGEVLAIHASAATSIVCSVHGEESTP